MERRIEKYAKKLSGDNRKRLYDAQKDQMVKLETKASEDLVKIEIQIKNMALGYPALHLPYYIIFGKEIYSKQKKFKGQTLLNELRILDDKWEMRGLNSELLMKIKLFYVPSYYVPVVLHCFEASCFEEECFI
ncbi:hypothetical protein ES703_66662 [subsurface metagenome]